MRYIGGEFVIDFLSTFPFRKIAKDNPSFQVFASVCQLLRVFRARKLYYNINRANISVE